MLFFENFSIYSPPKKVPNEYTSKEIDNHVDGCYRIGRVATEGKKFKIGASSAKSNRFRRDSVICNYNSDYCSFVINNKFKFSMSQATH